MQNDKLKKILALTTSDNDHEALVAIRQANILLQECGMTWSKLFEVDITEEKKKYELLQIQYTALAHKYNQLVQAIANRRAAATVMIPRMPIQRRRSRRL